MEKIGVVCLTLLFLLGGLSVVNPAHGAGNGTHTKEIPSDFDRLKTSLQQPNTLSALTPEWLDLGVEHRTRYETFNQSFTKGTAGSDQMVAQRTRILLGIKDIWDPIRFTLELADFRALVADRGQDHNPNFVDHLDIFQLHLDLVSQNFLGTGSSGKLEVGRLVMDFGQGRLVAGHRFGSFTPSFDGVQLTLGGIKALIGVSGPLSPNRSNVIRLARIGLAPLATFPVRRSPAAMSRGLMGSYTSFS